MTTEAIEAFYAKHGFVKNRFGKWMSTDGNRRAIITERILRVEKKLTYDDGSWEWMRTRSAYHGTLSINEKGRLAGKWY